MFVLCLSVLDPPGVEPNPTFTSFAPFVDGACYWNSRSVRVGSISGLCLCRGARNPSGSKPTTIRSLEHQTLPGISRRVGILQAVFQVPASLEFAFFWRQVHSKTRLCAFSRSIFPHLPLPNCFGNHLRWHGEPASGERLRHSKSDRSQKKNRRPTGACQGPTPRTCV